MAKRKAKQRAPGEGENNASVTAADKIAGLLALIATRDMDTDAAALKLNAIGFSSREISSLLDVGPNYVNVARHRKRGGPKKPRKA